MAAPGGLMPKDLLIAVGVGILSAVAATSLLVNNINGALFTFFAPLPVLLLGLSRGLPLTSVALVTGFVAAGVLGGPMVATVFGLVDALPAWLVIRHGLRRTVAADGTVTWAPAGSVLAVLAMAGAALYLGVAAMGWLSGEGLEPAVQSFLDEEFRTIAPTLSDAERGDMVAATAPLFPGVLGGMWVLMAALNGIIGQAILGRVGRAARPTPSFPDLALPGWFSWGLVLACALALLGPGELGYMGRGLALILAVPFLFVGLAVVHTVLGRYPQRGLLLGTFYLVLVMSGWAVLALVTGVGMIEQWAGLRHRLPGPDDGKEIE